MKTHRRFQLTLITSTTASLLLWTTSVCGAAAVSEGSDRSLSYDSSISLAGVSPKDTRWLMVTIANDEQGSNHAVQTVKWQPDTPLPQVYLPDGAGKYTINVYSSGASLYSEDKYKHVKSIKVENKDARKVRHLLPSLDIQSNHPDIIALAQDLTVGLDKDYDKARAIYDWVVANIQYDREGVEENNFAGKPHDAVAVMNSKMAVCAGYSNLMAALLRAVGIRTRVVIGKLLGQNDNGRSKAEICKTTNVHAWNEAYIEKRWITMDSTTDSGMTRLIGDRWVRVQTPGNRANFDRDPVSYKRDYMKCSVDVEEALPASESNSDSSAGSTAGGTPAVLDIGSY